MRCIVTGVAGFIGSHLATRLIALEHDVVGIDCFTPYYQPALKHANLAPLVGTSRFTFVEGDLAELALAPLLAGADYVFHLAAQVGVRSSWGADFAHYARHNIVATQRLLDALKDQPIRKLVYASSSSVYGNARLPMRETAQPRPVSPYGVSKLAAEQLCAVYHAAYGLPTISLRFFTVYGPRQRPDMAFHRFIQAAIAGMAVPVYGDGRQSRDFTFVDDVVTATIQAALIPQTGIVINVASGTPVTILEVIAALQDALERRVPVSHLPAQAGDLPHTTADSRRACRLLDFQPGVTIVEGLNRQVAWQLALRRSALAGSAL